MCMTTLKKKEHEEAETVIDIFFCFHQHFFFSEVFSIRYHEQADSGEKSQVLISILHLPGTMKNKHPAATDHLASLC